MVEDLLEVTHRRTGQLRISLQPVSLSRALLDVSNTFKGVAEAKKVKFIVVTPRDLPEAFAEVTRLQQA